MGKHFAYAKFLTPDMIADIFDIICCHQNLLGTDSILSHSPLFLVPCPLPLCFILSPPASQCLWVFPILRVRNPVTRSALPVFNQSSPPEICSLKSPVPRSVFVRSSVNQVWQTTDLDTTELFDFFTRVNSHLFSAQLHWCLGSAALLWSLGHHLPPRIARACLPACLPASPSHHSYGLTILYFKISVLTFWLGKITVKDIYNLK